jgi:hypothetical protein
MKNEPNEIHFDCPKCKRPMTGDKALLGEMINCPDCNEPFMPTPRRHEPESEPVPEPASSDYGKKIFCRHHPLFAVFGLFALVLIPVLLILLYFVWQAAGPKEKTWREFSDEAEPMMLAEASNHIIGFRRVIHAYVDDHGDYKFPNGWKGNVKAEYINSVGGVSVTNVPFKFNLVTSYDGNTELHCSYDWKKDLDEEAARSKAEYDAEIKAIQNRK